VVARRGRGVSWWLFLPEVVFTLRWWGWLGWSCGGNRTFSSFIFQAVEVMALGWEVIHGLLLFLLLWGYM
jgi:hypothetical protein